MYLFLTNWEYVVFHVLLQNIGSQTVFVAIGNQHRPNGGDMIFQTNKRLLELEEGYKDLYLKYRALEDQACCRHVFVRCDECDKFLGSMTIKEYHQTMVDEHTAKLNE